MINLPKWRLTSPYPAFLDSESGTAIEQTAKVYGAMQELIDEYNAFAGEMETKINNFEASTAEELETYKTSMRQEFQDFIDTVDMKIAKLKSTVESYTTNVEEVITAKLNEALASGAITINAVYNEETESLDYSFSGEVV